MIGTNIFNLNLILEKFLIDDCESVCDSMRTDYAKNPGPQRYTILHMTARKLVGAPKIATGTRHGRALLSKKGTKSHEEFGLGSELRVILRI
jgi:hypothetical protein